MIAHLQRLIVIGLISSSAAWIIVCLAFGHPALAVGGTFFAMFSYSIVLAAELVVVWATGRAADGKELPNKRELIQAWWGETRASPGVFFWRQPFRVNAESDSLPVVPDGSRGVVLVHGFVCNRAFWNPWLRELRRAGINFIAVNLEPPFESIGAHSRVIDDAISRLSTATGVTPLVVAHSMGGLAVRHWLAGSVSACKVHHIITIGTPHRGTWLARFSRTVPGTEMALNSDWLNRLDRLSPPSGNSLFTCFYSNTDNVVFPASSAQLLGADNRLVRATGHVQLAFEGTALTEVRRRLQSLKLQ